MSFIVRSSDDPLLIQQEGGEFATRDRREQPPEQWFLVSKTAFERLARGHMLGDFLSSLRIENGQADPSHLEQYVKDAQRRIMGCSMSPEVSKPLGEVCRQFKKQCSGAAEFTFRLSLVAGDLIYPSTQFSSSGDEIEIHHALKSAWAEAFSEACLQWRVKNGVPIWPVGCAATVVVSPVQK